MFEKVSLIDNGNLGTAYYTLPADEKYPLLNTENLTISIQMQLSQKKKNYFSIFGCIFEI